MQQNAETLNDYFVNVAGSKDSTSEEFDDHPSVHCIKIKNYNLAFKFHTDNLNPKKSVGIEKISSRVTSLSSPVLSCEITRVITDFINTQSCLLVWKSRNVTPLHKKAHEKEKSNHRPFLSFQLYPKYTRTFCLTRYTLPYLRIFLPTCLAFWRVTLAVWL